MRGVRAERETVQRLIERTRATVGSRTFEQFETDRDSLEAYRLAMIGEHCNRLPKRSDEPKPR
jgi:hypothetical protein